MLGAGGLKCFGKEKIPVKENKEEILEELEQALLEEEAAEALEEGMDQADTQSLLKEPVRSDELVYRNYSNHYGADLRNYASGYQARNTDRVDVDLEKFSRQVTETEKLPFPWVPLVVMLLAAAGVVYMLAAILAGIL